MSVVLPAPDGPHNQHRPWTRRTTVCRVSTFRTDPDCRSTRGTTRRCLAGRLALLRAAGGRKHTSNHCYGLGLPRQLRGFPAPKRTSIRPWITHCCPSTPRWRTYQRRTKRQPIIGPMIAAPKKHAIHDCHGGQGIASQLLADVGCMPVTGLRPKTNGPAPCRCVRRHCAEQKRGATRQLYAAPKVSLGL